MEKGFYKNANGTLLFAPNRVTNKDYILKISDKDTYTYPLYGWSWFATRAEALSYFGIEEQKPV